MKGKYICKKSQNLTKIRFFCKNKHCEDKLSYALHVATVCVNRNSLTKPGKRKHLLNKE